MKAFLAGCAAAILIAVIAALALQWVDRPAQSYYQSQTGDVRL